MAEIVDMANDVSYSTLQQLYALNFAANAVGELTGTQDALESAMQKELTTKLLPRLPGWNLAWGPKVWKQDPNRADTPPVNAWYVATKEGRCVLAIAGTAPKSVRGWLQDFDVVKTVQWDEWVSKWPKEGEIPAPQTDKANDSIPTIAHGTAEGVQNILTNKSTRVASGTYVQDFLKQQPAGTEFYMVGHSMGGALAPTVALGLVQSQMIPGNNVNIAASAGASPGNTKFAQKWRSQFKDANFYNTQDVIPQAWQVAAGQDRCFPNIVEDIFKNQTWEITTEVKALTFLGETRSRASHIAYAPVPGEPFTSDMPIPRLTSLKQIQPVIHEQHVKAYVDRLGIADLIKAYEEALEKDDGIGVVDPEQESVPADK